MKKIVIASLIAASSISFAATVTLEGSQSKPESGSAPTDTITMTIKAPISSALAIDASMSTSSTEASYKSSGRAEAGLSATRNVFGPVDGYVRIAAGEKMSSGAITRGYYSSEVGAVYRTPFNGLNVKLGYRVRNSFEDSNTDSSTTTRLSVSYNVTKMDIIGIRTDIVNGAGAGTGTALNYTRVF